VKSLSARLAISFVFLLPIVTTAAESVLIEFTSSRCRPCQQMQPVIAELSRTGVAVRTVDVDREPELTQRYSVQQTPTFIVLSSGKELTRLVGVQSIDELRTALAINPAGPWVDTNSKPIDTPPLTRLAPLPTSLVPPAQQSLGARPLASEPMPSVSVADAIQRAEAATVRLRVFDGNGHGAGTGTIIDTHGEEALVLTCGHLFRDTKGQGRIEVDLFVGGETRTVEAQLVDYDADSRDIALVAIRPGVAVQPVKVIGPNELPSAGDTAFSFGCDRGADPSRRDTRVTGVNKYNQDRGGSNLEIAGAPIDGRSGGGLFDAQGRLIGVCNAADYEGDVGIYAGPGSVHWQLDRVQLSRLYQSGDSQLAAIEATAPQTFSAAPADDWAAEAPERFASLAAPTGATPTQPASLTGASPGNAEIIVIVRDQANPDAEPRVMTLSQPSPEFMQMLEMQAGR
jgi:thiol-disulfide isomerase/thioredoxin